MTTAKSVQDRTHSLWDELADFQAAQAEESLHHLMRGLCRLVDAQTANWIGAVRMASNIPHDPVKGWRPRTIIHLDPYPQLHVAVQEQTKQLEAGEVDLTTVRNVATAGTFRANRLADLAPPEWFESAYYRKYYLGMGRVDAIWAGVPVNEDAETYFGIFRDTQHAPFTPEERDTLAYALRGLKWFHRQQMLSRGLLVASSPLTLVERQVLSSLLNGKTEKEIAAIQGQSPHTTHEYVTAIYRKFGVKNRASLMALWLGKAA